MAFNPKPNVCSKCGNKSPVVTYIAGTGEFLCPLCMPMKPQAPAPSQSCKLCGQAFSRTVKRSSGMPEYCASCFQKIRKQVVNMVSCSGCMKQVDKTDPTTHLTLGGYVCHNCWTGGYLVCSKCGAHFNDRMKAAPYNTDPSLCRSCEKKAAYFNQYPVAGTWEWIIKAKKKFEEELQRTTGIQTLEPPQEFWFSYNGTWFQAWRFIPKSFSVVCPICDTLLDVQKTGVCSCKAVWLTPQEVEKEFSLKENEMAWGKKYRNYGYEGPKGKGSATATWDAIAKAYKFKFDYDADFVAIIKQFIPSHERSYDPPTKTWILTEEAWEALKDVAALKFNLKTISKEEVEDKWKEFRSDTLGTKVIDTDSEFVKFQKMLKEAGVDFDITKRDDQKYVLRQYRRALLSYYHPDKYPERANECSVFNSTFQNLQKFFGLEKEQEQLA